MSKSTKILAVLVIFLGIIYGIQKFTSSTSTTENLKPFSSIDTANIREILFDFGQQIVLDKEGSKWVINSPIHFSADEGQVSLFLSRITTNPSAFVVADNPSDSSSYGLGSTAGLVGIQESNGKNITCRVGNVTPDFNGCYVQIDGKSKILDLSSNLRTLAAQSLTNWRDKNIFPFHLDDLQVVDFSLSDTLYHFLHRDTAWQMNGTAIPASKAESIIGSFIGMTATDFIDSTISREKELFDYGISLASGIRVTGKVMSLESPEKLSGKGKASGQIPSMAQTCISSSANNQTYVISSFLPNNLEGELRGMGKEFLAKRGR